MTQLSHSQLGRTIGGEVGRRGGWRGGRSQLGARPAGQLTHHTDHGHHTLATKPKPSEAQALV